MNKLIMQAYSDPKRADDPHALPDIEVFYHNGKWSPGEWCAPGTWDGDDSNTTEGAPKGWYWWSCFPGCLPDSEPLGPFTTEAKALSHARRHNE
jgi:hypothetical protein